MLRHLINNKSAPVKGALFGAVAVDFYPSEVDSHQAILESQSTTLTALY